MELLLKLIVPVTFVTGAGKKYKLLVPEKMGASLASSGSNQARKGRLVDALAVRGDEGRDTLR